MSSSFSHLKSFGEVQQPVANGTMQTAPAGHATFRSGTYQGYIAIALLALEPVHVGAGVSVLGTDVGSSEPLVRLMTQQADGTLIIPGTSIKGCLRSMYEAVTPSTLGVASGASEQGSRNDKLAPFKPSQYKWNAPEICPASQVFGAMGYQGLVSVADGVCDSPAEIGTIPILYSPDSVSAGDTLPRKFYRALHVRDLQAGEEPKTAAIQQAAVGATFTTQLRFKNLSLEALGILLVVLGQDESLPLSLKLGAAKGYGFGTMRASVTAAAVFKTEDLERDRYLSYRVEGKAEDTDELMERAIAAAHGGSLLQGDRLQQLRAILPVSIASQEVSNG